MLEDEIQKSLLLRVDSDLVGLHAKVGNAFQKVTHLDPDILSGNLHGLSAGGWWMFALYAGNPLWSGMGIYFGLRSAFKVFSDPPKYKFHTDTKNPIVPLDEKVQIKWKTYCKFRPVTYFIGLGIAALGAKEFGDYILQDTIGFADTISNLAVGCALYCNASAEYIDRIAYTFSSGNANKKESL